MSCKEKLHVPSWCEYAMLLDEIKMKEKEKKK